MDDMVNNFLDNSKQNSNAPTPVPGMVETPTRYTDEQARRAEEARIQAEKQRQAMIAAQQLTPEQQAAEAEKTSHTSLVLTIVMGGLAVLGVAFGIWGIISSVMANSKFDDITKQLNSLTSETKDLNQALTSAINSQKSGTSAVTENDITSSAE